MAIKIVSVLSLWCLLCGHSGAVTNYKRLFIRPRSSISPPPSLTTGQQALGQLWNGSNEGPVVNTGNGIIQGFGIHTVEGRVISAFQSIPYAEAPVGPRRFKDPVKSPAWNGTLQAIHTSPQCIQMDLIQGNQVHGQEDCLYLNVYTPSDIQRNGSRLPVMVFFHGGAFYYGSGSPFGPRYLLDHNIVLVTVNYRLGPFGFFSTEDDASPGNQGLKDQVLALKWVQTNIGAFGGRSDSITVVGQSAGADAAILHILSPASRHLVHRVIAQSGSPFCYWSRSTNSAELAARVGGLFNCSRNSAQEMIQCLQGVPAKELSSVQLQLSSWTGPFALFGPTVEHNHPGAFITKRPEQYYQDGEAAPVPLIAGVNSGEGSWRALSLINDTDRVHQINEEWDEIGPAFLDIYDTITEEEQQDRLGKIWEFYMGGKSLSWETRKEFSQMFGDRNIMACSLEGMRYHSLYTKQPVYGYHFNYKGRYSILEKLGGNPADWGASNLDELIYLFNNTDYYSSLSEGDPDLEMSQVMTNIWTNFATYSTPYIAKGDHSNRNERETIWKPIQPATVDEFAPRHFLNLDLKPVMIKDPFEKRYNFWKQTMDGQL